MQKKSLVTAMTALVVIFFTTLSATLPENPPHVLSELFITGEPDEMPRFPGCEDVANISEKERCALMKLGTFLSENLKYPQAAKKAKAEGTVVVSFTVDEHGKINEPQIAKKFGYGCEEEALRVVRQMPDWIPGRKDGKAISVEMKLPVKFKLSNWE